MKSGAPIVDCKWCRAQPTISLSQYRQKGRFGKANVLCTKGGQTPLSCLEHRRRAPVAEAPAMVRRAIPHCSRGLKILMYLFAVLRVRSDTTTNSRNVAQQYTKWKNRQKKNRPTASHLSGHGGFRHHGRSCRSRPHIVSALAITIHSPRPAPLPAKVFSSHTCLVGRSTKYTRSSSSPSRRSRIVNKTHIYLPASSIMATPAS